VIDFLANLQKSSKLN